MGGNVVCLGTSNFVYFYLYNGLRAVLLSWKKQAGEPEVITANLNLLVSAIAGIFNVMMTNPLWVAGMRLTTMQRAGNNGAQQNAASSKQEFSGVLDALTKIGAREGIRALWNGAEASLLLQQSSLPVCGVRVAQEAN